MNVLITGAQGFIGRFLAARLLEDSKVTSVTGIGRSSLSKTHFTHYLMWQLGKKQAPLPEILIKIDVKKCYRYVSLDLNDTPQVIDMLHRFAIDHIVHLAGVLRSSPFASLMNNNVAATQSLLDAVAQSKSVVRFIIGSSGSVYGRSASLPAVETDPCNPLDLYAVSKLTSEHLMDVHSRDSGLSTAVARIFNVIGPGLDERHLCAHLARQFAELHAGIGNGIINVGPLESTRDFIDIQDVADALVLLLHKRGKQAEGVFNLASGIEQPTQRIYDLLEGDSGSSKVSIDRRTARKLDIDRAYADISRLRAIGFTPRHALPASLRTLRDYYQANIPVRSAGFS